MAEVSGGGQPAYRSLMSWYNENDPKVAAWLRELIRQGLLPEGEVDDRSIQEISPDECPETAHFFAGIGGWPYALELAGWPSDQPVWTGSCPCQPLSSAGRKRGADDPRHLWPVWYELIRQCRPPTIFGEQVASNLGREWLAGVRADLEDLGYAFGATDLCASSEAAPHIRQRLFWVADSADAKRRAGDGREKTTTRPQEVGREQLGGSGATCGMAYPYREGIKRRGIAGDLGVQKEEDVIESRKKHWGARDATIDSGSIGGLDNPPSDGTGRANEAEQGSDGQGHGLFRPASPWDHFDLVDCADGGTRRIESGTFPLAHGLSARMGRLRGYGNAIVPKVAATFIRAFKEATGISEVSP